MTDDHCGRWIRRSACRLAECLVAGECLFRVYDQETNDAFNDAFNEALGKSKRRPRLLDDDGRIQLCEQCNNDDGKAVEVGLTASGCPGFGRTTLLTLAYAGGSIFVRLAFGSFNGGSIKVLSPGSGGAMRGSASTRIVPPVVRSQGLRTCEWLSTHRKACGHWCVQKAGSCPCGDGRKGAKNGLSSRNRRYAKLSVPLTTSTNGDDESEEREARASPKWTCDTPEAFIRSTCSARIQVLKKLMVPKLIPPTQNNLQMRQL